ncbi:MAG: ABC transporter substrate-binding protein [Eubacteriales bacterium]|nr:ABC transporter substrate-binding protein [Eubacteriales bacterium]
MKNRTRKIMALMLAVTMASGMAASAYASDSESGEGRYTYATVANSVSTWSPSDWEMSDEFDILGYTSSSFYGFELNETLDNYEIVPAAAAAMPVDVTADYAGNETYGVPADATEGYAWQIDLKENLCWEDGTPITADDYVYTLQQMLNPEMKNFRASSYYDGNGSLANAKNYYNSGSQVYNNMQETGVSLDDLTAGDDGVYADADGNQALLGWTAANAYYLDGYALSDYASYFAEEDCAALDGLVNEDGYVPLTDEVKGYVQEIIESWGDDLSAYCYIDGGVGEAVDFSTVGIVKNNDYSLTFITTKPITEYYVASTIQLQPIKEDLYEACKKETGGLIKSTYGTSADSYMSSGPYKIVSYQADKEMVLTKNENWFGWEDEYYQDKYQTTDITIQMMTDSSTIFSLFLQGNLSAYTLNADQITEYATSDYIYTVPGSNTYSLFFNIDEEALKTEDGNGVNHSILSIQDFRQAISLCMDRSAFSQYMYGYTPAYSLINEAYLCDPEGGLLYTDSEAREQLLCNLYGVEDSSEITGYDPEEATALFQSAYEQALEKGLMTESDRVQIDFHLISNDTATQNQINFIQDAINKACQGTGLEGKVTINLVLDESNLSNARAGLCDMIFLAWGGAEDDPYWMMLCYCTEDFNLTYGYDVYSEMMTIDVEGEEITKSAYDWYMALHEGEYVTADMDTRNSILAQMEEAILTQYGVVPLASQNSSVLYQQRLILGSEEYVNSIIGFGGLASYTYTMDDAEWDEYCKAQNYQLQY